MATKKKLVVLSGAGISAESGLRTFREMGGLWEEYDVMDVASPQGWKKDPELVTKFYNDRRKQLLNCKPNDGHLILHELEKYFDVEIITQNVDDLHERAGSTKILHLHGELLKARSTVDENLIYDLDDWELTADSKCEKGSRLRPHIVWFGEAVPAITEAAETVSKVDIMVIVGTSMNVYPAAGLIDYAPSNCPIYIIDPHEVNMSSYGNRTFIKEKASVGMKKLLDILTNKQ
ncbi:NAD-dependent deacylase [Ancylomarina sp. 16SWW S1-10-2]|uniref:SIR2 family NAD-dependent protein deacylase n=1 Tax=Ancylomarina sp. 16SWW S1-10-2 TaxID=2499681 RepID=UPI0012AE9B02|nr:NAD-dependent deacylase [Ancylomarina sp. 16SWW S1-10-2]MRT93881.1 NAD-dependent deacylase [Ancylomarina sp. 16SWW S1-10-2]